MSKNVVDPPLMSNTLRNFCAWPVINKLESYEDHTKERVASEVAATTETLNKLNKSDWATVRLYGFTFDAVHSFFLEYSRVSLRRTPSGLVYLFIFERCPGYKVLAKNTMKWVKKKTLMIIQRGISHIVVC